MEDDTKSRAEIGKQVFGKQIAYGNSFGNTDKLMKMLYPNECKLNCTMIFRPWSG